MGLCCRKVRKGLTKLYRTSWKYLRKTIEWIYQKKCLLFSLVNSLTIIIERKTRDTLIAHTLCPQKGLWQQSKCSSIWLMKSAWQYLLFVFHLNSLNPGNHFQMYLVLFTVNSYTLMSCCHGPVTRQTSPTSRCEVTFRQRLTCFLFQWSHCTVNICNGNTAEKMQYGLTGVKLQPSRNREEDAF